jgi:hypothetical protein
MDLKSVRREGVGWIILAQDKDQWWVFVKSEVTYVAESLTFFKKDADSLS